MFLDIRKAGNSFDGLYVRASEANPQCSEETPDQLSNKFITKVPAEVLPLHYFLKIWLNALLGNAV